MPVSGDQDIIEKRSPGFSECADIGESGGFSPLFNDSASTTTSEVAIKDNDLRGGNQARPRPQRWQSEVANDSANIIY